jgi:hypothetical protein
MYVTIVKHIRFRDILKKFSGTHIFFYIYLFLIILNYI